MLTVKDKKLYYSLKFFILVVPSSVTWIDNIKNV